MTKEVWLNLPVKDVAKAVSFFTHIGFTPNPHHSNGIDSGSFFIGAKNFVLMLFPEATFKPFIQGEIIDTAKGNEMLISYDAESREEVDEIAKKVVEAGGIVFGKPSDVQGWMYGMGFCDLDGHRWNVLHMDMSKIPN